MDDTKAVGAGYEDGFIGQMKMVADSIVNQTQFHSSDGCKPVAHGASLVIGKISRR